MSAITLDRDTCEVIELLDGALAESGLSQAAFAAVLGTSASRLSTYRSGKTKPSAQFLIRAQRIARGFAKARSRRLMTARDTSAAIFHSADDDSAWRMLLQGRDHLRLALSSEDHDVEAAWEGAPGSTGGRGFDTLLAALVEKEFDDAGEEAPAWAHPERLPTPWIPEHPFLDSDEVRDRTPEYLSRLNLFVPARDLVTA